MRIKDLISRAKALGTGTVYFGIDDATSNAVQKIDYNALAQAIIEQYASSTLAGTAQSVKSALDGIKTGLDVVYGANPIKTLAATDDLLTLDVGMYRVANVLPLNCPTTTYKYGYATKQHRGASGYTYYEFIVGNGNGNDFKRYYGWQYSNSATSIDWIEMAPQSAVDALNSKNPGTPIDIKGYNSAQNKYTAPSDGYVQLQGSGARVVSDNGNTIAYSSGDIAGIYIKRNMIIYVTGSPTIANFIPLS